MLVAAYDPAKAIRGVDPLIKSVESNGIARNRQRLCRTRFDLAVRNQYTVTANTGTGNGTCIRHGDNCRNCI